MRFVFLVMIVSCGWNSYPPVETGPVRTPIEQRMTAVTVYVKCISPVLRRNGTGVLYDRQTVITANHVVSCPFRTPEIVIRTIKNDVIIAAVKKQVTNKDVAILALEVPVRSYVPPVSIGTASIGGRVFAASMLPRPEQPHGLVADLSPNFIRVTSWTRPGNSGSGVYNSRGRLVGIVSRYYSNRITGEPNGGGIVGSLWGVFD